MTPKCLWTRLAAFLALTAILAACGPAVTPAPTTSAPAPAPTPTERQATCDDSAIRLLDHDDAGVHGAIFADTLHMGGATAPATCLEPANQSLLAGLSLPDGRTKQAQQSRYYLIVIRYPGGNRLYVLSRRGDGTSCVVDTNDQCIARVTDLPDDFDLETLPDDVAPTIPAGRPAPPTVGTPGDDAPPAPSETPPGTAPPTGGGYTPPVVGPPPGDGAPPAAAGTPPGAAGTPQPSDGANGVKVGGPLLSWAAAPRALSYDVYWGATKDALGTPINTSFTALRIAASSDLDADTRYYWRVDAKNEAGTTRGTVWSFTTAPAPEPPPAAAGSLPGAATQPQPSDGATGVMIDRPLVLVWAAAPRASSHIVYWGRRENDLGMPQEGNAAARWISPDWDADTRYYWRVDAKNEAGTTRGTVWSFTTAPAAAPPPAPSPPPAEATLSISADQSVHEGDDGRTDVGFTVTLSSPVVDTTEAHLHVYWRTVDGTATSGWIDSQLRTEEGADYGGHEQYSGIAKCYNAPEGSTPRICGPGLVGLTIYGDQEKEEDETVFVEIAPAKGFQATCGRCRAKLTIIDDD